MTTSRTATATVAATTNPRLEAEFVALMVESHNAPTLAERYDAERRGREFARRFRLDEFALEGKVLEAVFASMTTAELEAATADPSRRIAARAELRRRDEVAATVTVAGTTREIAVDPVAVEQHMRATGMTRAAAVKVEAILALAEQLVAEACERSIDEGAALAEALEAEVFEATMTAATR